MTLKLMCFWVNVIKRKEKILKTYDSSLAQVQHVLRKKICKGQKKGLEINWLTFPFRKDLYNP